MPRASLRLAFALFGMTFAVGCSDGRLPTYPVTGQVVFADGSPAHVGTVEFRSRDHKIQARGDIDKDGVFRLTTYKKDDGAVVGKHDCVVVQMVMTEELANFQPSYEGVIDPRFGSYATSGLVLEVSAKDENFPIIRVEQLKPPTRPGSKSGKSAADHQHHHDVPKSVPSSKP